ncbi:hypothetical protein Btru_077917 [Bulinus truncatus]|nr:hypothetical protein Btru_077917 [Bulinus truncatus]
MVLYIIISLVATRSFIIIFNHSRLSTISAFKTETTAHQSHDQRPLATRPPPTSYTTTAHQFTRPTPISLHDHRPPDTRPPPFSLHDQRPSVYTTTAHQSHDQRPPVTRPTPISLHDHRPPDTRPTPISYTTNADQLHDHRPSVYTTTAHQIHDHRPSDPSDKSRRRKPKVKSLFPVSAAANNRGRAALQEDILDLTRLITDAALLRSKLSHDWFVYIKQGTVTSLTTPSTFLPTPHVLMMASFSNVTCFSCSVDYLTTHLNYLLKVLSWFSLSAAELKTLSAALVCPDLNFGSPEFN